MKAADGTSSHRQPSKIVAAFAILLFVVALIVVFSAHHTLRNSANRDSHRPSAAMQKKSTQLPASSSSSSPLSSPTLPVPSLSLQRDRNSTRDFDNVFVAHHNDNVQQQQQNPHRNSRRRGAADLDPFAFARKPTANDEENDDNPYKLKPLSDEEMQRQQEALAVQALVNRAEMRRAADVKAAEHHKNNNSDSPSSPHANQMAEPADDMKELARKWRANHGFQKQMPPPHHRTRNPIPRPSCGAPKQTWMPPAFTRRNVDVRPQYAVLMVSVASDPHRVPPGSVNATRAEIVRKFSFVNHAQYCARHGYDLIVESGIAGSATATSSSPLSSAAGAAPSTPPLVDPRRSPHYAKIRAMRKWLSLYSYILYCDLDSLIMDFGRTIESIVADTTLKQRLGSAAAAAAGAGVSDRGASSSSQQQPLLRQQPFPEPYDMVLTKDYNGVNSGVMLLRNSSFTQGFLRRMLSVPKFLAEANGFHDQGALAWLIDVEGVSGRDRIAARADRDRMLISEDNWMNSYPEQMIVDDQNVRLQYRRGDFIVHFASFQYFPFSLELMKYYYLESLCVNGGADAVPDKELLMRRQRQLAVSSASSSSSSYLASTTARAGADAAAHAIKQSWGWRQNVSAVIIDDPFFQLELPSAVRNVITGAEVASSLPVSSYLPPHSNGGSSGGDVTFPDLVDLVELQSTDRNLWAVPAGGGGGRADRRTDDVGDFNNRQRKEMIARENMRNKLGGKEL